MCILMYFGPSALPIRRHLDVAVENNPDGFGWAIVTRDHGILSGTGMDSDKVIADFIRVRELFPDDTALFHARIATQGSVCKDNCHPFPVSHRSLKAENQVTILGDMVLAHNGMLPVYPGKGDDRSDTRLFADEIFMRRFPHLDSAKTKRRLESYLGGSKLVILTTDPAYQQQAYIFNEDLGLWIDHDGEGDIWYSNTSYQTYRYSSSQWLYGGTTLGYAKATGSALKRSWWDDAEEDAPRTRLACRQCHYAIVYCQCTGHVVGIYLPESEVKTPKASALFTGPTPPEEDDDPSMTWVCLTCETEGSIDESVCCSWCLTMFCCNLPQKSCVCWDDATKRLRSKDEIQALRKPMALTARPADTEPPVASDVAVSDV